MDASIASGGDASGSRPVHVPQEGPNGSARMPMLDAVKGLACLVIVGHHPTRYGPMPMIAFPLAPALIHWLSTDGRLAVQVFLVIAGFLAAGSIAPAGRLNTGNTAARIARRYGRLVMPYLAALIFSVLVAAVVRPWLHDDAVPGVPNLLQLVAHGLLLQDLLGYEALSAGVWYVAIDFQLFALSLVAVGLAAWIERRWRSGARDGRVAPDLGDSAVHALRAHWIAVVIVLGLATGSLVFFNRHAELDTTALYFFGAYGLGMLTFWIGCADRPHEPGGHAGTALWRIGLLLLVLLGAVALALDWRSRIVIALVTALAIAAAQHLRWLQWGDWPAWARPLAQLGRMSYSLFLIHFPIILLVSALVGHCVPATPWVDAAGMVAAVVLSIVAASLLYRRVELRPATWRGVLGLFAALLVFGAFASL